MLELLLCSLLTILPDYLFRRYVQGRRLGKEITFYSVWFELRWGITACLMLTVGLITVIFYNHPSTTNVTAFYRTVPIVPEANGRVAETFVGFTDEIKQGQPIFRLDSSKQEAAVEAARKKIAEIDAEMIVAKSDIAAADGKIQEARVAHQQAVDELETKQELQRRNPGMVPARDIEKLQLAVEGRQGTILSATACEGSRTGARLDPAPGGKGKRRGGSQPGAGRPRQDGHPCWCDRTRRAVRVARRRHRQPVHAARRRADPGGCRAAAPAGRLRPDRGPDHEGRHDRGGHLRVQAVDGHPHGGHGRAGLHRRRPVPRRGATGRPAAGDAPGNDPRLPGAALRRRARRRDPRQQLHRERLQQQPRFARIKGHRQRETLRPPRRRRGRARARHDPAHPGIGAPDQDAGLQRALNADMPQSIKDDRRQMFVGCPDDATHRGPPAHRVSKLQRIRPTDRDWLLTLLTAVLTLMIFVFAPLQAAGVFLFQTFAIAGLLVIIGGALVISGNRIALGLMSVAFVANFAVFFFRLFYPWPYNLHLLAGAWLIIAVTLGVVVAQAVFGSGRITYHRIVGAILLYLLIAVAFATLFAVVGLSIPDAFKGIAFEDDSALASSLFYLSFVTLTSTGYGDIVPMHPLARSLCNIESIVGQLYPATILARLVTLELEMRS